MELGIWGNVVKQGFEVVKNGADCQARGGLSGDSSGIRCVQRKGRQGRGGGIKSGIEDPGGARGGEESGCVREGGTSGCLERRPC